MVSHNSLFGYVETDTFVRKLKVNSLRACLEAHACQKSYETDNVSNRVYIILLQNYRVFHYQIDQWPTLIVLKGKIHHLQT